jgi:hypothetical protein
MIQKVLSQGLTSLFSFMDFDSERIRVLASNRYSHPLISQIDFSLDLENIDNEMSKMSV